MSQDAGGWPPQGGYSQGYPSQGQPGNYGQQPPQGGYPPGGYGPQGAYGPQAGYPPQGYQPGVPGGYPPVGPGYGGIPPGGPPAKKSPAMIIGIVAAAVVLLLPSVASSWCSAKVMTPSQAQPSPPALLQLSRLPALDQPIGRPHHNRQLRNRQNRPSNRLARRLSWATASV